ncbi:hypothetical protein [Shewanella sp. 1180_01]|uniref:hypothetical protein n=1 Tax=Shewanella sp. 1180_01 TaxID=2604451 RepID=UPI0040641368
MITLNNDNAYSRVAASQESTINVSPARQSRSPLTAINELDNRYQDTVTLSSAAKRGQETKESQTANTYEQLAPGKSAQYSNNDAVNKGAAPSDVKNKLESDNSNFLQDAMQAILDKRSGIDREKLKELEAKMEEIANDENLSPEQKAEQLKLLQQQKEELLKEFAEKNEQRQQQFDPQVSR